MLVNGSSLPAFIPGKGLQQGDHFSPYLFILVSEFLSILIDKAITDGSFSGIKLSNNGPHISHSLFADIPCYSLIGI